MTEEKKEIEPQKKKVNPLGETEAVDDQGQISENLPNITWPLEKLIEAATRDNNMEVRSNAVNALARIGGPEVTDTLIEALKDPDDPVKANAILGLTNLGKDLVQEKCIKALQENENERVRAGVAWVLGEMLDEKSKECLKKASEDDESILVRIQAKGSLLVREKPPKD
ncbi:MAG: HEAT repeat domain-containing protein [Methanotrichaceae archaeon]